MISHCPLRSSPSNEDSIGNPGSEVDVNPQLNGVQRVPNLKFTPSENLSPGGDADTCAARNNCSPCGCHRGGDRGGERGCFGDLAKAAQTMTKLQGPPTRIHVCKAWDCLTGLTNMPTCCFFLETWPKASACLVESSKIGSL